MRFLPIISWDLGFPRLVTFVLAVFAGLTMAYWGGQWSGMWASTSWTVADGTISVMVDTAAVTRALGGAPTEPAAGGKGVDQTQGRLVLVGVVAMGAGGGAALIAVDGAAAQPFRLGSRVAEAWILQSLSPRQAILIRADRASSTPEMTADRLILQLPERLSTKAFN